MSEDAFSFYRGTCHLFYEDLSKQYRLPDSPLIWISGDLHIENFGSYKGDNRLVYFDLNDFEEAALAPAAWEIARIITSIFIAFDSDSIDISEKKAKKMAELFLRTYSTTLQNGKALYIEPKVAKGIVRTFLDTVSIQPQEEVLQKRTYKEGDELRLLIDNKDHHIELPKKLKKELMDHIEHWAVKKDHLLKYRCIDVVFRIAGTGSIGVKRYCFLFRGLEKKENYRLLDMKEARVPSLKPYIKIKQPRWPNEAKRICFVQECMQNNNPGLLSSTRFKKASYVIRELQPSADKIDLKLIKDRNIDIEQVITDMAMLTASAQIRSSGRKGAAVADDLIKFGNKKQWQKKIVEFSKTYSKEVKKYYDTYLKRYKEGYF